MSEAIRELIIELRRKAFYCEHDAKVAERSAAQYNRTAHELEVLLNATSSVLDKPQPKGMKQ